METIITQLYSLFIYIISGFIIGILFDIFRILRKSFNTPDFITYLEDIIFWILTGFILLYILLNFSYGQIRLYNIIGLIIGFILYMILISKTFIKVNVIIINFIKSIFNKIINILLFPIKKFLNILKKFLLPFTFLVINIKKTTNNFYKTILKSKKIKNFNKK